MSPGIFLDAFPRSEVSGNPSFHYENKFLKCSRFQYPVRNVVLVLTNSAALLSPCSIICLYYLEIIREKMMPNSLNFRRELRAVLLEQVVV